MSTTRSTIEFLRDLVPPLRGLVHIVGPDVGPGVGPGVGADRGARHGNEAEPTAQPVLRADPDADVLALVADGDLATALCRLMRRHGTTLYRYCREALRDATLADDIHQQVFIEAFRDLPRFRGRSNVRTWLFAIARNRVLDAVKARKRLVARLEAEPIDVSDPRPAADQAIDDARLRAALARSLDDLGEDARTAVLLRYQQGFTFAEMAEICGEKPGTLYARVARAMPLLRAGIQARMGGAW